MKWRSTRRGGVLPLNRQFNSSPGVYGKSLYRWADEFDLSEVEFDLQANEFDLSEIDFVLFGINFFV
jgi:hypothetical protein